MNDIEVLEDINYINEILKEKLSADEYGKVVTRVSIIKADLKERQSDKERIKDLEEINEAHKKENGELRERVKELEESEKYIYEVYQDAGKKMFEYAEELEKKDKIIDYMATAISNYDSQLVINTYENKQHVKEVFEEYYNYKIEKGE